MDIKDLNYHFGFRPRDAADRRFYCPERDIAYIVPILMQLTTNSFYKSGEARSDLDELPQEEQDQLADMVLTIGRNFCEKFLRGDRNFHEALSESGFDAFPKRLRNLWLAHLGHTLISAFYHGVRSAMTKGQDDNPMPYDKIFDTAENLRRYLGESARDD